MQALSSAVTNLDVGLTPTKAAGQWAKGQGPALEAEMFVTSWTRNQKGVLRLRQHQYLLRDGKLVAHTMRAVNRHGVCMLSGRVVIARDGLVEGLLPNPLEGRPIAQMPGYYHDRYARVLRATPEAIVAAKGVPETARSTYAQLTQGWQGSRTKSYRRLRLWIQQCDPVVPLYFYAPVVAWLDIRRGDVVAQMLTVPPRHSLRWCATTGQPEVFRP